MNRRSITITLFYTVLLALLAAACNSESETIVPIITENEPTRTQDARTDSTQVSAAQTPNVPEPTDIQVDLAPRVNGYTCCKLNTPAPARGTMRLVVVDDDCTRTVTAVPVAIPDTGPRPTDLWRISFARPTIRNFSSFPI